MEIVCKIVEFWFEYGMLFDKCFLWWWECEFEIFCSVEEVIEFLVIWVGFIILDDFILRV